MKDKLHAIFSVRWAIFELTLLASAALGIGLFAAQANADARQERGGERPNILLIVADDMGWSDIEPFGG